MEKTFDLTKEESKILNLMSEGYTLQEISDKMDLPKHIIGHRTFAMRKRFDCKSTIQLVVKILRENFL